MTPHHLTTAERAVLDAARTLARTKAEVEAAMDAWMAAGEHGCGAEWDRLVIARRARKGAADRLYDVASSGLDERAAADVPAFLRGRLPVAAPEANGGLAC